MQSKRTWRTPILIDMIELEKTASGVQTTIVEHHCVVTPVSNYSSNYAPSTSGGVVETSFCPWLG